MGVHMSLRFWLGRMMLGERLIKSTKLQSNVLGMGISSRKGRVILENVLHLCCRGIFRENMVRRL